MMGNDQNKAIQRTAVGAAGIVVMSAGMWALSASRPDVQTAEPVGASVDVDDQLAGVLPSASGRVVKAQGLEELAENAKTDSVQVQLSSPARSYDFIVRFEDVEEVDRCIKTFRQEPTRAAAEFRSWASQWPALDGFELTGASYSGEAILTWTPEKAEQSGPRYALAAREKLMSLNIVRYADLDATAYAEEK